MTILLLIYYRVISAKLKIFFSLSFRIIAYVINGLHISTALNIVCSYTFLGCNVTNKLNITSPELALIESATGLELWNKTNDDVETIYARNKIIHYFPHGLEKVFKNLQDIWFNDNEIKEIRQKYLKPLSKLEWLDLSNNQIETLEEGIFDFNLKLERIELSGNKISCIAENIFTNLPVLKFLGLDQNLCINMTANDNRIELFNMMEHVKFNCSIWRCKVTTSDSEIYDKKIFIKLFL